MQGLNCY